MNISVAEKEDIDEVKHSSTLTFSTFLVLTCFNTKMHRYYQITKRKGCLVFWRTFFSVSV